MNPDDTTGLAPLQFHKTTFELVVIDGLPWVRAAQVGQALGYRSPRQDINNLYARNADEFTDEMTIVVQLADADPATGETGQVRDVRLFSPRGVHLLAIFARTTVAKAFRQWVLTVLEHVNDKPQPAPLSLAQELSLINASVRLMEKVHTATDLDLAEALYLRLLRVNRLLGMTPTVPFFDLARACLQRRLELRGGSGPEPTDQSPH